MIRLRARLAALAAVFLLMPLPGLALCGGEGIEPLLSPALQREWAERSAAMPHARGTFWRATRAGQELRLIGTVHIHDPRLAPLTAWGTALLEGAARLLVEATPEDEARLQAGIAADPDRVLLEDGRTLPGLMPPEAWEALSAAAAERGIPGFMAARFRPWYLSMVLAMPPCAMEEMAAGKRGLDHALMAAAGRMDVPLAALESYDTLFAVFERMTLADQLSMLQASVSGQARSRRVFASVLDLYFDGRHAAAWQLPRIAALSEGSQDRAEIDRFMEMMTQQMLTARNTAWIPVIEAAAAEGPVVVAAGAAHLPGETGLLALLAGRGWQLERLD